MIPELGKKISIEEIEKSLKTTRGDSAPGMDGFSYDFIKMNFQLLKTPMLKSLNTGLRMSVYQKTFPSLKYV